MSENYEYVMEQFGVIDSARRAALTYQEVADGAGESVRTVEKIARKEILRPGNRHCERLAAFFKSLNAQRGANLREKFEALITKRTRVRKAA